MVPPTVKPDIQAMMREVKESNGRKALSTGANGVSFVKVLSKEEQKTFRDADARLEAFNRRRAQREVNKTQFLDFEDYRELPPIPLEIAGADFGQAVGVRPLGSIDFAEIGVWLSSAGFSIVDISDLRAQTIFNAALLLVGITEAGTQNRFFGSWREVEVWQREPGASGALQQMRGAILSHSQISMDVAKPTDSRAPQLEDARVVRAFHFEPGVPEDAFDLIRYAAYHAGPVARACDLFQQWRRQEPTAMRQIAQALPMCVATSKRENHQVATAIVTELRRGKS
jgi:hypothetical protein